MFVPTLFVPSVVAVAVGVVAVKLRLIKREPFSMCTDFNLCKHIQYHLLSFAHSLIHSWFARLLLSLLRSPHSNTQCLKIT